MALTQKQQERAAEEFAKKWQGRDYEKGESQTFWLTLLRDVLGVEHPEDIITFEDKVAQKHMNFIDGYIETTHVMIEQKSIDKDLSKPIRQSDGTLLTPYQQAKRYSVDLGYDRRPRWIVVCNFAEFRIYDMKTPSAEPIVVFLKELKKKYFMLQFLVNENDTHLKHEMEVSFEAGTLVGRIYDLLHKQYRNPENEHSQKSLNVLCVRLVFCLYAEDAGIFGKKNMFHDYLLEFRKSNVRDAIINLFKTLDTKPEDRDPYLNDSLAAFPYVNGGLFSDESIEIPRFTDEIVDLLVDDAGEGFDWSDISPTIFGAVFESTLNQETRRQGGMHYTSIENIHKVIDPLFLDDLKNELAEIKNISVVKTRNKKLREFQSKLASMKFFDPAAGSGNFLTETYLSLRKLENAVIEELTGVEIVLGDIYNPIQVTIQQFYGIEINDFAVSVARTALWIAESQMMKATENIVHMDLDFLPLKTYTNIHECNALEVDWKDVLPPEDSIKLFGNPPFRGARVMDEKQKHDLENVFYGWKNAGNLDYVACWFKKASDYIAGTAIRTAFVSTNSISQGDSVGILWKPLFEKGVHIDFAYRTFQWDSESNSKAHVHCVIIGFSSAPSFHTRIIYNNGTMQAAENINAYLIDSSNVFVSSRNKPICKVPEIGIGNKPIDDGNYLFTKEEMLAFIKDEPGASMFFKEWYGAKEFIHRQPRYCLWLGESSPSDLKNLPMCRKRIEAVRAYRLNSKSAGTRKIADIPTRFHVENMPKNHYIAIPEVSSQRRRYIPMGYMDESVLCSNKLRLMPNATLFHFGILESNVHMAWMRTVCGRLKSDYDYSIKIVYNNFPWPNPTDEQKMAIEKTAQGILDARAKYPDSTMADLYDPDFMPKELLEAHRANDKAVMKAYGFYGHNMSESDCVAELLKMYQKLVENNK